MGCLRATHFREKSNIKLLCFTKLNLDVLCQYICVDVRYGLKGIFKSILNGNKKYAGVCVGNDTLCNIDTMSAKVTTNDYFATDVFAYGSADRTYICLNHNLPAFLLLSTGTL